MSLDPKASIPIICYYLSYSLLGIICSFMQPKTTLSDIH